MTVEERNLLSVGYKNVVGARRASWRILSSIEQKEEAKGNDVNVKRIKEYRQKVESELNTICGDIMTVIDEHLIPSSTTGEPSVFFYKMSVLTCYFCSSVLFLTEDLEFVVCWLVLTLLVAGRGTITGISRSSSLVMREKRLLISPWKLIRSASIWISCFCCGLNFRRFWCLLVILIHGIRCWVWTVCLLGMSL